MQRIFQPNYGLLANKFICQGETSCTEKGCNYLLPRKLTKDKKVLFFGGFLTEKSKHTLSKQGQVIIVFFYSTHPLYFCCAQSPIGNDACFFQSVFIILMSITVFVANTRNFLCSRYAMQGAYFSFNHVFSYPPFLLCSNFS